MCDVVANSVSVSHSNHSNLLSQFSTVDLRRILVESDEVGRGGDDVLLPTGHHYKGVRSPQVLELTSLHLRSYAARYHQSCPLPADVGLLLRIYK